MMAKMIYANRLRHSLRVEMAREIERSEGRESVMSVFDCVVCSRHTTRVHSVFRPQVIHRVVCFTTC